ncbi:MAG: hypothetical protein ACT4PJ_16985 [Gemmatimonadaceae bacterium]
MTSTDAPPRPYYAAPVAPSTQRRLLLIAYHFPPAQTAGALRWQKLSHFAAQRGIALDVITCDPAQLPSADSSRLADLPAATRVFTVPDGEHWILRPERALRGALKKVRARGRAGPRAAPSNGASTNGAGPVAIRREDMRWLPRSPRDLVRAYGSWLYHAAESVWARRALALGMRLSSATSYDAVISCGPPHMPHEAARRVARARTIPFVMDLRDPWSLLPDLNRHYASPLWFAIAETYERRAVRDAALIVMNTEPARDAMRAAHPAASDRIMAVLNGYDDEPMPASRHGDRFVVAYAGSLYMNRDPRVLFRAARRVIDELGLAPLQLGLEFIGNTETYGGTPLTRLAEEERISSFVTAGRARPRREALEFLAGATMLVNLPQDATLCVPSKVFEYMQFSAWVLALEPRGSATELVLRDTRADVVAPDDVDGIAAVLRRRYLEYRSGVRPSPIVRDGRFSRRHQAAMLLDALERRLPIRQATHRTYRAL